MFSRLTGRKLVVTPLALSFMMKELNDKRWWQ
jgi:hypothetical protein